MKTLKIIGFLFLIGIVILLVCNLGPVWLQRLVGFNGYSSNVFHPQWINNEEYCYLQVESYFDYGMGFTGIHEDFYNPLKKRSSNATFSIYKVNIKNPGDEQLIKRITRKVRFKIAPEADGRHHQYFIFRLLEDKNIVFAIRDSEDVKCFWINLEGKVIKTKNVSLIDGFREKYMADMSPNGEEYLSTGRRGRCLNEIFSDKQNISLPENDAINNSALVWITPDTFLGYYSKPVDEKDVGGERNCKIVILKEKGKEVETVYEFGIGGSKEYRLISNEGDYSPENEVIYLSKLGVFKKQGDIWNKIKDLSDMEYSFYYPNISLDGEKVVGVINKRQIKVLFLDELIR